MDFERALAIVLKAKEIAKAQGMVVSVSKGQRADEDALLPPTHHRVPERRRVVRRLDAVPRPRRIAARLADALLDQPLARRDLTRGRVDEEERHRGRG